MRSPSDVPHSVERLELFKNTNGHGDAMLSISLLEANLMYFDSDKNEKRILINVYHWPNVLDQLKQFIESEKAIEAAPD